MKACCVTCYDQGMKIYGLGYYREAGFDGDRPRCLYSARKMYHSNCFTLPNRRSYHTWSGCRPSFLGTNDRLEVLAVDGRDLRLVQPSLISLPLPVLSAFRFSLFASLSLIPCSVARTPRPRFVLQLMTDPESRYYGLWQSQRAWDEEGEDFDGASADTDNGNSSRAP